MAFLSLRKMDEIRAEWGNELPSLQNVLEEQKTDNFCMAVHKMLSTGEIMEEFRKILSGRREEFIINEDQILCRVQCMQVGKPFAYFTPVVIPRTLTRAVLTEFHGCRENSHQGVVRTYLRMRDHVYWPNYQDDIYHFVSTFPVCIRTKSGPPTIPRTRLQTIGANRLNDLVSLDILSGLPKTSAGHKHLVVMTCNFTKYAVALPIESMTVVEVADSMLQCWVLRFGAPQKLLTDRGGQFVSDVFLYLLQSLQTKKLYTTTYHPQADGTVERLNRSLTTLLAINADEYQQNWARMLPYVLWTYNTTP